MSTTEAKRQQTIAETIADLRAHLEESITQQDRLAGVMLGQGFIVQTGSKVPVSLKFEIVAGVVDNPVNALPWTATRFTRLDAQRIARNVKNGHGEVGFAVFVKDAIHEYIGSLQQLIQTLEERHGKA